MEMTAYFRRQAAFCLRLSDFCSDSHMADHLRFKAAEYHQQALRAEFDLCHDEAADDAAPARPTVRH